MSSRKIPFLFLKYWYGDFSNCWKGILNPYLYYALNNESRMAKFQAIICHRSFVVIKMLGLRYVAGAIPGKSLKRKTTKVTTSRIKGRSMRKIERHVNLTWSGWPITNGWITMRATTSWHAKLCLHIWICKRIKYCT